MSGILDSKSRVMDAILTSEGRRQMAEGTFEVSYVTFSDADVAYIPDQDAGHVDPTSRIYFEACNLPQDQITFEANDEGKLVSLRRQDIKLKTPGGDVPSSVAEGTLVNGRLTVYQYHHGRRIKTSFIQEVSSDLDKGFVYTDSTGLTGKVLAKPSLRAGQISASASPYVAYFGTKGGLGPQQFAQTLSGAIESLRLIGGPNVRCSAVNESVYMDTAETFVGTKLLPTGTLSSPLLLEEGAIGGRVLVDELQNASFASQIRGILTSSFDNFEQLQTISTINRLFEDHQFDLTQNEISFDMSKLPEKTKKVLKSSPRLNSIDSLFNDDKMSHMENYMYLPPIVKTSDSAIVDRTKFENYSPYLLGDYPSWGDNEKKMTYEKLMSQLQEFSSVKETIYFEKTSRNNNVIAQFFEITDKEVKKLDVIDFGTVTGPDKETHNVFFVGKTFLDNRGTTCYVNMFTIVFKRDDRQESESLLT